MCVHLCILPEKPVMYKPVCVYVTFFIISSLFLYKWSFLNINDNILYVLFCIFLFFFLHLIHLGDLFISVNKGGDVLKSIGSLLKPHFKNLLSAEAWNWPWWYFPRGQMLQSGYPLQFHSKLENWLLHIYQHTLDKFLPLFFFFNGCKVIYYIDEL